MLRQTAFAVRFAIIVPTGAGFVRRKARALRGSLSDVEGEASGGSSRTQFRSRREARAAF